MANIINGRNLNLYYKYNGVTYPACFATDCKLTLTADTQETTTKNNLKGKTFNYQGKYSYTLSLRGITSLIDIPGISQFNYTEHETLVTSNMMFYVNGIFVDQASHNNETKTSTITSGNTYKGVAFCENIFSYLDPNLTLTVTKNGVTIFAQTILAFDGATLEYEGIAQPGAVYQMTTITKSGGSYVTPVNIPDTDTAFAHGVNVGTFQDYILLSNKMDFIFSDSENIEWSGTVLLTQVDNDSPVDNVSTFTNAMLGDGELTKVTGSIIPPPVGSAVTIIDQLNNILASVQAPGTYSVLRFDSIDLRSIGTTPQLIIMQSA